VPQDVELTRADGLWVGRFRAMAGPCEALVEGDHPELARRIVDAVAGCAWRIENKFSRYRADSVVGRINSSEGDVIEVDDETANLIDFSAQLHELSGGRFDITSGVLRRAWSFDGGARAPSKARIDTLLPFVGWSKVHWDRPRIRLRAGMELDFGGIGKEYAVDQAAALAAQLSDAAVLINFGGDLIVTRERRDRLPWRVGIEGIDADNGQAVRLLELSAGALATSGDTYRYVLRAGERLPHVLDPLDGQPVRGAPRSVTVAAPTCTQAGMLATLAMLRGAGAEEFLQAEGVRHWLQR
jgi:thiamine biosynthesis lipoprotein